MNASPMLRRAFFLLTLLLFSAAAVPKAIASTLDFDDLPAGTLVTTPISGVTFTLANNTAPSIFNGISSSSPNSLLNAPSFDFSTPSADLTLTFDTPVSALRFDYAYENGDLTFKILQGATMSTITHLFDSDPLDIETIDFSLYNGITSLTMSSAYPDDYFAIDRISFTPVPEPATGFILIIGIATMGAFARRAKARS